MDMSVSRLDKSEARMSNTPQSTNQALNSPRGMVAYKESTADPIFLFQVKQHRCSEAEYLEMGSMGWVCDEGWIDENGNEVTQEMFLDNDFGTISWDTQKVFAHREEARRYGQSRPYAWGDEGEGWRVYCVGALGELRRLLLAAGDYTPDQPSTET